MLLLASRDTSKEKTQRLVTVDCWDSVEEEISLQDSVLTRALSSVVKETGIIVVFLHSSLTFVCKEVS